MTKQNLKPISTYEQLITWCIAAPVLAVWMLVSFLPMVSMIRAWGDPGQVLIALAFLATGALSLLIAAIGYRLITWQKSTAPIPSTSQRTRRTLFISGYAVVWMTLYALIN